MASICTEYESEVQENQRRPANLLDALERGNHCIGVDSDVAMGEEKVAHFLQKQFSTLYCLVCVTVRSIDSPHE